MQTEDQAIKRTALDTRREKFENTSLVAQAMIAADRKARAEKNARLRAAREARPATN